MAIISPRFRGISLVQFVVTFVPFALLLTAALVVPERSDNPTLHRVQATIWLATALLLPGLCLYALPQRWWQQGNYALLLVTWAYLAYLTHFYFATFHLFGGLAGIFRHFRLPIALLNVTVTVWWTIDTLLAWFVARTRRWLQLEQAIVYTFLYLTFVVTELFLRPTEIRYLGWALAVAVPGCLLLRIASPSALFPATTLGRVPVSDESPGIGRARLWFAFGLLIGVLIAAHVGAEIQGALDARIHAAAPARPVHSTLYYRLILTIWATTALLTPALCAFVLTRRGTHNSYWKGLWTAAYLAFLTHLFWAVAVMFRFDFYEIFHTQMGVARDPERVVENPGPDLVLAAWWTVDVALLWLYGSGSLFVKFQRGALHLLAFVMFFGALVLAEKASLVAHLLGIVMALLVTGSFLLRVLIYESDPRSLLMIVYIRAFQALNTILPWHKLPTFLAVANLGTLRDVLRARNLHDTSGIPPTRPAGLRTPPPFDARFYVERQLDGYYNDLSRPDMGCASSSPNPAVSSDFTQSAPGARFGRNIPLNEVGPLPTESVLEPNPRLISRLLLARPAGQFQPATTLNLLAAAWIQFQTHDWFNHGTPVRGREFAVPLPPGDDWHSSPMLIRRTRPDPTRHDPNQPYPDGGPADGNVATFANAETHWWDGSEIYGSSAAAAAALRSGQGGKLRIAGSDGLPELHGLEETGLTVNWWLGLSLLHSLFVLEHNAICGHLQRAYPTWDDGQLYRVARLVNTALIAKIHTVDWTPAILGHPALQIGMRANWWGLASERVKKAFGRISHNEAFSGIAGSATDHHTADYCLTEEFTSVYRMHPLMPDGIHLRALSDDRPLRQLKLGSEQDDDNDDVIGPMARQRAAQYGSTEDMLYSFGIAHPGALVLRNFPNWMRRLRRLKGGQTDELIDLAAIDVVRDRERGVPRYNRFRQLFHLPEFDSLEEMIGSSQQLRANPDLAEALRNIYRGDVNQVDLMVGMYAETPPEGFGFSDTAFRVFILMASRRIKSDRFLSSDYTPAVYSQAGMDWVESNDMRSVLMRHYPALTPAVQNVANVFAPWRRPG